MSSDAGISTGGEVPPTIGRYKINARLASGQFVDVYRGFDPMIERPVVVKLFRLPESDASAAVIRQTFYREMQRVGALMHEGIAALFDAGDLPGGLFMASEFVDGSSLGDLLKAGFDVELPMRVSVITQITDALEYARHLDVVHLSLRASNVLIGTDYALKVGGFGTAPVLDQLALSSGGWFEPTPYTAPERTRGEPGDARTDVFSLAKIALNILAGPLPTNGAIPALPAYLVEKEIDARQWTTIFERALAAEPSGRFHNTGELKDELLLLLGVGEAEARLAWEISRAVGSVTTSSESETLLALSSHVSRPDLPSASGTGSGAAAEAESETMISSDDVTHTGVTPSEEDTKE